MPDQATLTTLRSLIIEGVEHLRALDALLTTERRAVETRELEQLEQCTAEKSQLLPLIEQNFAARQQALTACGVDTSAEGWHSLLEQIPVTAARVLQNDWQKLTDLLTQVQQANQVNHQLLHHSRENTDRLINLLQGKGRRNELYGRSGGRDDATSQSSLGKA